MRLRRILEAIANPIGDFFQSVGRDVTEFNWALEAMPKPKRMHLILKMDFAPSSKTAVRIKKIVERWIDHGGALLLPPGIDVTFPGDAAISLEDREGKRLICAFCSRTSHGEACAGCGADEVTSERSQDEEGHAGDTDEQEKAQ